MNPHKRPSDVEDEGDSDTVEFSVCWHGAPECWWIGPALILTGLIGLALIPILQ